MITKHPGTGGLVSVGTVTAQLLYEIAEPAYAGPDVTAWFDTIELSQAGADRVLRVRHPRNGSDGGDQGGGELHRRIPQLHDHGGHGPGHRGQGRRGDGAALRPAGGRDSVDEVDVRLLRFDHPLAEVEAEAAAHLVVTVKDADPQKVGRRFSNAVLELTLASFPGFHTTTPPSRESAYGVYWPTLVPGSVVPGRVVLPDGSTTTVPAVPGSREAAGRSPGTLPESERVAAASLPRLTGDTIAAPLGVVAGARSGDKGGNANVGFWTRTDAAYGWLRDFLTVERLHALLPEADGLEIRRFELPNLRALNFVVVGLLGDGVASSTRPDPQAKALGEFLRSRVVPVPVELVP